VTACRRVVVCGCRLSVSEQPRVEQDLERSGEFANDFAVFVYEDSFVFRQAAQNDIR
jgi:hypothetical protein